MRTIILLAITIVVVFKSWPAAPGTPNESPENSAEQNVPSHVREFHKHKRLYLSGSLTIADIQQLSDAGIERIIRLNGGGNDTGHISRFAEQGYCNAKGIEYHYFNIDGDPATAAAEIAAILDQGNALVHCKHGAHRAPAVAAYWLLYSGYTCPEILPRVGWEELYHSPGQYAKYTTLLDCGVVI